MEKQMIPIEVKRLVVRGVDSVVSAVAESEECNDYTSAELAQFIAQCLLNISENWQEEIGMGIDQARSYSPTSKP